MGKGKNEAAEGFSPEQMEMYKECFKLMDVNKDGTIDKNDLRGAFDNVGVLMSDSELDDLLGEIGGACTYDNMVKMFQERLAGEGNDPDDLIIQAFSCYDVEGKIDVKMFQYALQTWGDKMNKAEIDEIFDEYDVDEEYMVKTKEVLKMFVAQKEEEKKAPEPEPEPEPVFVDEEDDPKKKKKKKKKAAK
jgi:Ca2+-binding EF-hand superfamily protein